MNKLSIVLIYLFLFVFSSFFVSSWILNGTVYDVNGNTLNGTNISVTAGYFPGGTQPNMNINFNSTLSGINGNFSLSVNDSVIWSYQIKLFHKNLTTNTVDFIGQSLPYFPYQQVSNGMTNINFYLKPAGTLNITAINSSGDRINFNYQIKDNQLGYTIDSNWNAGQNGASEATVYLPLEKNYSIMLYPRTQGLPLSYSWNNFSAVNSYDINPLSSYNSTTKTVRKQFNTTTSMTRITGYINGNSIGINGWDSFTVIPMILESGRFIFLQHSAMPYNMSSWDYSCSGPCSDIYNYSTGFFNITIPGPAETQNILMYVAASNNSNYYGSYKNITINYGQTGEYNFTMYGLLGNSLKNISMGSGFGSKNILTKMMDLNLVNATSNQILTINPEAHIEVKLDYSSIGVSEFTITDSVSGTGTFYLPLLNISGVKEISVFPQNLAPRIIDGRTVSQLNTNNNITMSAFNPQTIGQEVGRSNIFIGLLKSNSSCDIPNPDEGCYIFNPRSTNMTNFNPMSAIIGGGKLSFVMGMGGVKIHYVNVDLLASGPPDVAFDNENNVNSSRSGSNFAKIMRFGSKGPKIYDYALVSMPYDEQMLREYSPVNISIPALYDEDWNVVWNTSINGTDPNSLSNKLPHYQGREREWGNLTLQRTCTNRSLTNTNQINETNPCYIDTTRNKIWIRIPHFSGTGPQVTGQSSSDRYVGLNKIEFFDPTEITSTTLTTRNYMLINVSSNLTDFTNLTVYLYNSSRNLTSSNTTTDPTLYINISGLADGTWYFNATAANSSAWSNSTETRNVTVHIRPPYFITSVANQDVNYSQSFVYYINATDAVSLANYSVSDTVNFTINSSGYLMNNTVLAVGRYILNITINDSAGHQNSTKINVTVKLAANQSIIVNTSTNVDLSNANANLTIYLNNNVTSTFIVSKETPTANGTTASLISVKGINLTSDTATSGNLSWAILTIYYTDSEISGLDESNLKIYYYNETAGNWQQEITIVSTTGNYLYANITHFSLFGIFGSVTSTTSSSGGGGGGSSSNVQTITLTESSQEYKSMSEGSQLKFSFEGSTHTLEVDKLAKDRTYAEFILTSDPLKFTLKVGEEKIIDLLTTINEQLYVKLISINSARADLIVKKIIPIQKKPLVILPAKNEEAAVQPEPIKKEFTEEELEAIPEQKPIPSPDYSIFGFLIALIVLVVGLGTYLFILKKRDH